MVSGFGLLDPHPGTTAVSSPQLVLIFPPFPHFDIF